MPTAEGAGVPLSYAERGSGELVLLVHGMASDAAALAPLAAALEDRARVVAYDRRGYGASGAPEPYGGTTVDEQAEDAAALLRALGGAPAVVAGEGFGALVALDLLRRHRALVRAAALADPPLLAFVPEATEALAAERAEIEEAVREDGPGAGVGAWLGRRGAGAPPLPAAAAERARAAHVAFFADYAGLATLSVTRRELRTLDAPAVVVTAPWSAPPVVAAADRLAGLLPAARRAADGDLAAAVRWLLA
jgi:pimeloyl-ACP methyl ester carboxylesterase